MRAFNLLAPELAPDSDGGGSPSPGARVGPAIGAKQIGATLLELGEGRPGARYHFHHGIEEWLLVVSGSPSIRTPAGERALRKGDVVCFPVGPDGAHEVTGSGTVLIVSERRALDAVEYPESGEVELRPSGRTFHGAGAGEASGRRVVDPVNVDDVAVEGDAADPPGYRARSARLGPGLGAERLGGSVYELDPGESVCPYHYECVEEEWLLVLDGTATLRGHEGERELVPGDLVSFPVGPDGGQKVTNGSDAVVRILMLSTIPENDLSICIYPDSAKLGVWPWPGQRLRLAEPVGYYDGEV